MTWDNTQAFAEGWGLFDFDGTGVFHLERLDESRAFESDEAKQYVAKLAQWGSEYHQQALKLHGTVIDQPHSTEEIP